MAEGLHLPTPMDSPPSGTGAAPPPRARDASGILAVRTGFQRRRTGTPRPKLPRPSSRALLILFGFVVAGGLLAAVHRGVLDREFARKVSVSRAVPFEIKKIRMDLAEMELDEKTLANALDARLKYFQSTRANEFYISIDTRKRQFSFHFANKVLRDAPVRVGPGRTVTVGRKVWTFAPLSGAFNVKGKYENGSWTAPAWAYAMIGQKPPKPLRRIPRGLGRYVIALGNDYVIHSPPPAESPLRGAKPGSFLVPEADLAAIWPRVGPATRVYVLGAEGDDALGDER